MISGRRGPECGDHIEDAVLKKHDHVHIPFYHEHEGDLTQFLVRLVETVKLPALVKQWCFRCVQILGFFFRQDAATKTDGTTADIPDRKHDAVAETVVNLVLLHLVDDHTALFEQFDIVISVTHVVEHVVPAGRRKADAELAGGLSGNAAGLQIINGFKSEVMVSQGVAEKAVSLLKGLIERLASFGRRIAGPGFAGNVQTSLFGEGFNGFRKCNSVKIHDKANGITAGATTKTVIELFILAYSKRRGFFIVKWAAG